MFIFEMARLALATFKVLIIFFNLSLSCISKGLLICDVI